MNATYAHGRFEDLDLVARSQWGGKGTQKNQRCILSATSIKLVTMVGHFYMTLTLQTVIWLDHLKIIVFPLPGLWGF